MLLDCLNSLYDQSKDTKNFEVILCYDDDDHKTHNFLGKQFGQQKNIKSLRISRLGYDNLHTYYNLMSRLSNREYVFIFNDDAVINTYDWDATICENTRALLKCNHNHNLYQMYNPFPIIKTSLIQSLGHVAKHPCVDSWWDIINNELEIALEIHVEVIHKRPDLVGSEQAEISFNRDFFRNEIQTEILNDVEKIKNLRVI
jgi:hypothetical protein